MKNPNFLILDEPTNDLDIFVMSVLEDYLRTFEGCLIVVSHDRYFMDKMVDHLFVFEGQGKIKDIVGNYTEYRKKIIDDQRQEKIDKVSSEKQVEKSTIQAPKTAPIVNEKRKLSFKEKTEFEELEKVLEQLENEKLRLTNVLSTIESSSQEIIDSGIKLTEVVNEIEQKTERWLFLSEFI
jgi:ATP-binding cassette subfamily F protein uup